LSRLQGGDRSGINQPVKRILGDADGSPDVDVLNPSPPNPLPERGCFHRAAQIIDRLGNAEQFSVSSCLRLDYHLLSYRILHYTLF
jgi:hypothetical protein